MRPRENERPLDFAGHIAGLTRGFTGRDWVFRAIDDWLSRDSAPPFFLLTGEPGSGKSAIAGRLCQFASGEVAPPEGRTRLGPGFLAATHFCGARTGGWIDPVSFAGSVANQLAKRFPAYLKALLNVGENDVHVTLTQIVGTVRDNATVTGQVIYLDLSGLRPQEAFNRVVADPLRSLSDADFGGPTILLVDGLDESLFYSGDVTIVDLLAQLGEDLRKPMRFILTSPRESRVENRFRGAAGLSLTAAEFDGLNRQDLKSYVEWRLGHDQPLAERASILTPPNVAELKATVDRKADGNFQYAVFLLDSLAKGHSSFENLDDLPPGLDGLYFFSLDHLVKLGKKDWLQAYAPLLGVLAVAREGLTRTQLKAFTGLSETNLWSYMADLQQFIEPAPPPEEEERYRLFHQSVIDFLHRPELLSNESSQGKPTNTYFASAEDGNRRIVEHYRAGAKAWADVAWERVDDYGLTYYGLTYLSAHLFALRDSAEYRGQIYELLCRPFMLAKRARHGSHYPFSTDVNLALELARSERPPNFVEEVRASLISATLGSFSLEIPPEVLGVLVCSGHADRARELALLAGAKKYRREADRVIGKAFLEQGLPEQARPFLDQAFAADPAEELVELAPALARVGEFDKVLALLEAPIRGQIPAWKWDRAVQALAQAGEFDLALAVVERLDDAMAKVQALGHLFQPLAKAKKIDRADTLLKTGLDLVDSLKAPEARAGALSYLAEGLGQAGMLDRAVEVANRVIAAADDSPAVWRLMEPVCRVAPLLAQRDSFAGVLKTTRRIADGEAQADAVREDPLKPRREDPAPDEESGLDKALAVKRRVGEAANRVMALRWTSWNLVSPVPEQGWIVSIGRLSAPGIRANALSLLAQSLAAAGQDRVTAVVVDQLLAALGEIADEEPHLKAVVLSYAALVLARAGEASRAVNVAGEAFGLVRRIQPGSSLEVLCFKAVAPALALAGEFDQAIRAAGTVRRAREKAKDDPGSFDQVYMELSKVLARSGEFTKSLALPLKLIKTVEHRTDAFLEIVEALIQQGEGEETLAILAAIGEFDLSLAEQLPRAARDRVSTRVAQALIHFGENERAAELALRIVAEGEALTEVSYEQVRELISVAAALAEVGDPERATGVLERALASAKRLSDDPVQHLSRIALVLTGMGDFDRALAVLSDIEDEWENKAIVLGQLAEALASAGKIDQAVSIAETIRYPRLKAKALAALALGLARAGLHERAASLAGRALEVLDSPVKQTGNRKFTLVTGAKEPEEGFWVLSRIAESFTKAGDKSRSLNVIDRKRAETEKIEDARLKLLGACQTAMAFDLVGERVKAIEIANQAFSLVEVIHGHTHEKARALKYLAQLLIHLGEFGNALAVVQVIDGLEIPKDAGDGISKPESISPKSNALMDVADDLAQLHEAALAEQVVDLSLGVLGTQTDDVIRVRGLGRVLDVLAQIGRGQRGLAVWNEELAGARPAGREEIFRLIGAGALLIASMDRGETLRRVHQAVTAVEDWWRTS